MKSDTGYNVIWIYYEILRELRLEYINTILRFSSIWSFLPPMGMKLGREKTDIYIILFILPNFLLKKTIYIYKMSPLR